MTVRKNLTQNVVPSEIVGIDIGYGHVKAKWQANEVIFPSVAALASKIKFQSEEILAHEKHAGELLTDGAGQEWFIGNLAVSQTKRSQQIQLQGRDGNSKSNLEFRKHMLYTALAKLMGDTYRNGTVKVILSTGLPVDHMSDAVAMKRAFIGRHIIHTSTSNFVVDIETCYVMPQPKGTIYQFMFNDDGSLNDDHNFHRVAVADFGNFTIDLTVDEDGLFITEQSGSLEGGVFTVKERISELYEEVYGVKPSYEMVDNILMYREALIQGKPVNFSGFVDEATKRYNAAALTKMGHLWDKALEIEQIYVTGGGQQLSFASVAAVYPQAIEVEDPQFSNARGYEKYAKYKAR